MLMNNNDAVAQFLAKGGQIKKMPTRYAVGFAETAFDDWREVPLWGDRVKTPNAVFGPSLKTRNHR